MFIKIANNGVGVICMKKKKNSVTKRKRSKTKVIANRKRSKNKAIKGVISSVVLTAIIAPLLVNLIQKWIDNINAKEQTASIIHLDEENIVNIINRLNLNNNQSDNINPLEENNSQIDTLEERNYYSAINLASSIRVIIGSTVLKTQDIAVTGDNLVHVYTIKDTTNFKAVVANEEQIDTMSFAVIRLNSGQTPKWRSFGNTERTNGMIIGDISFSNIVSYIAIDYNEDFKPGYVYQFLVKAKMQDGSFTENYIYRFILKEPVYTEPKISVKYNEEHVYNRSIINIDSSGVITVSASHRSGIEYILLKVDNGKVEVIKSSTVIIRELSKLPKGEHIVYIHAIASTAENTGGESLEKWEEYTFVVP